MPLFPHCMVALALLSTTWLSLASCRSVFSVLVQLHQIPASVRPWGWVAGVEVDCMGMVGWGDTQRQVTESLQVVVSLEGDQCIAVPGGERGDLPQEGKEGPFTVNIAAEPAGGRG